MIKSMTAYGRATRPTPLGRWSVEIHSVNRKFLDVSIHLPRDFLFFDIEVRKWLAPFVQRGQVTVKISLTYEGVSQEALRLHVSEIKIVKELYEKVAGELGYDPKSAITLPFLFEQMQAFSGGQVSQKEDLVRSDLRLAVEEALKAFSYMKQTEGGILVEEIRGHLDKFEGYVRLVESKTADAEERYKAKLLARIEEAKLLQPEDHERVVREVMIYAEKIDITEEIARLGSHLQQFRGIFSASEGSVGRTMDFLLQEMNREVNTIASKSDDGEISANAIYMKSLLEKIREQVQNIE